MSELMDRLFGRTLEKQLVVGGMAVENWVESADGHQRNISGTLGLAEHEVQRAVKKISIREGEHFIVPSCLAPHVVEKDIRIVLFSKCIVCRRGYLNCFIHSAIVGEQCERFHEARWKVLNKLLRNFAYFYNFDNQAITQIFVLFSRYLDFYLLYI